MNRLSTSKSPFVVFRKKCGEKLLVQDVAIVLQQKQSERNRVTFASQRLEADVIVECEATATVEP